MTVIVRIYLLHYGNESFLCVCLGAHAHVCVAGVNVDNSSPR